MPYKDKEKKKKYGKKYYQRNKDKYRELNKNWRRKNPEKGRKIYSKYGTSEKGRKRSREWAKRNMKKQLKYWREKYLNDEQYNLNIKLRRRIFMSLKKARIRKTNITIKLLGCSYIEYKEHIERQFTDGMTWERVLNSEIHIDHIKPCASFDLSKANEQKRCYHYTNLQPLWATENISKHDKF